MLDDYINADLFSQRAVDLLHDRDAAEDIDLMTDSDAIASVTLATLAVGKRLSVVADQLAELTASIDRLARLAIEHDLHAERCARDRAEAELARLEAPKEVES